MKKIRQLAYILSLLLTLTAPTACHDGDVVPGEPTRSGDSLYVSLSIDFSGSATATRDATPNGGEEGDGWEYGRDYENRLHDFTVFVLNNYADINASAATPFVGSRYFSPTEVEEITAKEQNFDPKGYDPAITKKIWTYEFTIPVVHDYNLPPADSYRFILVANNGDLTSYTTIGALRDAQPTRTWTAGSGAYSQFVMANENDNFHSSGEGSEDDPIRMHVTLERMAARIDFDPAGATLVDDGGGQNHLRYALTSSGTTLAYLHLDRMAIVNGSVVPSYYIKRVADDISGTNLRYLGDETPVPNGIQTNFVLDPNSASKTAANVSTLPTTLFGASRIALSATLLGDAASALPPMASTANPITLGYVNENTFSPDMAIAAYTTGVVVQGRFEPLHNYYTAYNASTDELTAGTYVLGSDYWMVEPTTTGISEAQRLYFSTEAAATAYATNTAKRHYGRVVKYTGGTCYYYIYLRHSNNVDVVHNTMEFGIVRNNIYRFSLNAASGPGLPAIGTPPDPRDPEELKATVYVRKWLLVEHPVIYM